MNISAAYPSDYVKASDLNGKDVNLIIKEVRMEDIGEDNKPVVYFTKTDKGLVLNKTNANIIAGNIGTHETNDWIGKSITLFPTQVDFQGRQVEAIRVRLRKPGGQARPKPAPAAPPPPPELEHEHEPDSDDVPF